MRALLLMMPQLMALRVGCLILHPAVRGCLLVSHALSWTQLWTPGLSQSAHQSLRPVLTQGGLLSLTPLESWPAVKQWGLQSLTPLENRPVLTQGGLLSLTALENQSSLER